MVTIEDIAMELGVSKTTVSRALSGKGRIGSATRERVLRYAKECGYRPNVQARGLAQSKTYNLGFVLPVENRVNEMPFFRECMNGICDVAGEYNYDILIIMSAKDDISQLRRMITHKKIDGVIISRSVESSVMQDYLQREKIPFVLIGPCRTPGVLHVDNYNQEGAEELTSILLMKGVRRLALLGSDSQFLVSECLLQGFLDAHKKFGVEADPALIFHNVEEDERLELAMKKILAVGADGIICMNEHISSLALMYLRGNDVPVPGRMKLASLYDSYQLERGNPAVTSLRFNSRDLGRNACTVLLKSLGEQVDEHLQVLNYQVILRESTQ